MGPGRDRTHDLWISNHTCYRSGYGPPNLGVRSAMHPASQPHGGGGGVGPGVEGGGC